MSLPRATFFAALLSLVVNLIILYFARSLAPNFQPLSVGPVCFWTILGTIGACVTFALIRRWSSNPNRIFLIVASIVLLLSFVPDYMTLQSTSAAFKGATPKAAATLMLMHVVVAVIATSFFLRVRRVSGAARHVKPLSP